MRFRALSALPLIAVITAGAACDMSLGHLAGRATDEWTHTYQLSPGGELRIENTNGRIDVEPADGSAVEVRAEKIARAATDAGAQELLPRIVIKEDVKPDRVTISTERMSGIMIGAGIEVRYHVRAPKNISVDVSNTNGAVSLTKLSNKVVARTTNGAVTAKELTGPVEARTTNGRVNVDLASVSERAMLRTTNGSVTLNLPDSAKADLSATWTNGGIDISNVKMEVSERGRRRFEGRMNGGGAPIELHTTNGSIRIRNRADLPATTDTDNSDDSAVTLKKELKDVRPRSSGERR